MLAFDGNEDFGTERTTLMAAFNRSNGVCGVGMGSIVSLHNWAVYNDPRPAAFRGDGLRVAELEAE